MYFGRPFLLYTFLPFLMKEFPGGGNTIQVQLGWLLSSARMVIKFAVRRLKARFGALSREMLITITDLPSVIYACVVLHNNCELNNKTLLNKRIEGAISNVRASQPALMRERN